MLMWAEGGCMFEVYLNEKRDRLLVVAKGQPLRRQLRTVAQEERSCRC